MSIESLSMASTVTPEPPKRVEVSVSDTRKQNSETISVRSTETVELSPEMIEETVEKLEDSIEKLNSLMQEGQRALNFSVEKDLNKIVVKVMDVETEEVVRQFPNEEALKFAKHLEGMMGLLFSEKV